MRAGRETALPFGDSMKIKVTRNTVIGGEHVDAGSIMDVENAVAARLLSMGKAIPHKEVAPREATPEKGMTPEGVRFEKRKRNVE